MVATIERTKTKIDSVLEASKSGEWMCAAPMKNHRNEHIPGFCGWLTDEGTFYGISMGPIELAIELDLFEDGRVSIGDEMHHIIPDLIEGELADEWEPTKEQLIDYMKSNPNKIVIE